MMMVDELVRLWNRCVAIILGHLFSFNYATSSRPMEFEVKTAWKVYYRCIDDIGDKYTGSYIYRAVTSS